MKSIDDSGVYGIGKIDGDEQYFSSEYLAGTACFIEETGEFIGHVDKEADPDCSCCGDCPSCKA